MSEAAGIATGPVQSADVFKAGKLAARLSKTVAGVEFSYLESYLNEAEGTALIQGLRP